MLESITIASEATFDAAPQVMEGLSHFNYVFGTNGTGKTTLSRVVANCAKYPKCSLKWKNGTELDRVVYNRDFVSANFHECDELPGIFTLGEDSAETTKKIAKANKDLGKLREQLEHLTLTLEGADGTGGKKAALAVIEDSFRDACWSQKQKHDEVFKAAFERCRASKETFKEKVLTESTSNSQPLCSYDDLTTKAATVFADSPAIAVAISQLTPVNLLECEADPILTKRVVGKSDIDIAALIDRLGSSDWVRAGRRFYDAAEGTCPFCQQKAPETLESNLNGYFDEAFEKDTASIGALDTRYKTESARLQQQISQLLASPSSFLDVEQLKLEQSLLESKITINLQHLARKKKEPSQSIEIESLSAVIATITDLIEATNARVAAHNTTIHNLASEKKTLSDQIWRYLLDVELADSLKTYNARKASVNAGIHSLEAQIRTKKEAITAKQTELAELEKEITSIQPTIDGINRLLKSFGFRGFELKQADNQRCYKLMRPDGTDAKDTLSEGERTFVTFLYFYYLLKGSTAESGTVTDRVVVFDDPVSSLDSDILFIVGSLIKGLFDDVRKGTGQIKQVFVLTHNVYFHKEVSFNPKRKREAMNEETFWTVRKSEHKSTLQRHTTNPIKTSYELLWAEVRNQSKTNLTIQNTLRRILENYFRILGGVDPDGICAKFEGHDRLICNSLFSWVNDGSHSAHDDLYVSIEDSAVEAYLRVFRAIFEQTGHLTHFKMMMGDAYIEEEEAGSEAVEPANA